MQDEPFDGTSRRTNKISPGSPSTEYTQGVTRDTFREQRQFAVDLMATARLITDPRIRATIVALADKWLNIAAGPDFSSRKEHLLALQAEIGQELRNAYSVPGELSSRFLVLLAQINDQGNANTPPATIT
jgi:hypothetical protein